jgi:DNA replication and repair protein RecF
MERLRKDIACRGHIPHRMPSIVPYTQQLLAFSASINSPESHRSTADPAGRAPPDLLLAGRARERRLGGERRAADAPSTPRFPLSMSLLELTVSNLRCIEHAQLELTPGVTLIWGGNGSGKTSILEAIFLLGRGRSFRTRNNDRLIRRGQTHLRVTGQIRDPRGHDTSVGFEVSRDQTLARVGGRSVQSLVELAQAFPVQAIDPGVHRLVEEGGHRRRRWMDWAVFHVEPRFMDEWLRYSRTLRQRNAALKSDPAHADVWDPELARLGESIAQARGRFVEQLVPYWRNLVLALSGLEVELHYLRGWSQEHSLLEALAASRSRDATRELTHAGPHRADVALRIQGRAAREVLSRGQQKLIAAAMMLAQLRLLQDTTQTVPTLLLDDPAAELDGEHLKRFIEQIRSLQSQLVVTSLHAESRLFGAPDRTFHMVQGRVQPL